MSKTEHPCAQVLRWIADGETVEFQTSSGTWYEFNYNELLGHVRERAWTPDRYRLKPRTININGHEVPEPMRVAPKTGTMVYIVDLTYNPTGVCDTIWNSHSSLVRYLAYGICHTTREAAEAHARALLSFTTQE